MSDWNPALYTRFEDERTRPAAELLARVPIDTPRHVVDLGCGPGNSTELLVKRFPSARIVGTDSSQAMLAAARQRLPQLSFEQGDIAEWSPAEPVDLAYANASLQWVSDHERLLPRLLSALAPGGVLAVQMPDNLDEPSHRLMRDTAAALLGTPAGDGDDGDKHRARILPAQQYYDLLAPTLRRRRVAHHLPPPHGRRRGHRAVAARHRAEAVPRPADPRVAGAVSG